MFHVQPEVPAMENATTQHPWAHRIKDRYSNNMKYAHNSITNPTYPKKKKKVLAKNRVKFTIIGDRITKEFIYCVNLVKGLYKYRKKSFEPPVIRGVTTIEWPSVWNDLKLKYGGQAFCLTSSVAVLMNDSFLGGDEELKGIIEIKFRYHLCLDYAKESVAEFAKFIRNSGRPCAYMNIAIDDEHIGTLIFMLYSDIVPYTCENFLRLCNEKRGGYSGTPIQRIVKDGWIQGGGFALKETNLDCENFIVPHDRRGLLGMANAGRHTECSTQFFVLLQPALWMANKFVAFGQLIEGKETLDKIEAVPTWYESPTSKITIYQAGIFNMDCHHFIINKGTHEYIDKHIEDLNALGELLYEVLLENVFLTAQFREIERLKETGEEEEIDEGAAGLRETQRFNRNKEDIEKQLAKTKAADGRPTADSISRPTTASNRHTILNDNNDFDVETYDPEFDDEETDYQHQSLGTTPSLVVKPTKPYYLPPTDVPYPDEKDSNFDLKRFLQGDYCLESDLQKRPHSKLYHEKISYPSKILQPNDEITSEFEMDMESLDSEDGREIKKYLRNNVDRVSFAGDVIKNIAKGVGKLNIFDEARKSELITDDNLRRLRLASMDFKQHGHHEKKVSISVPNRERDHPNRIKRRQTGYVHSEEFEKSEVFKRMSVDVRDYDYDHDSDGDDDDKDVYSDNDEGPSRKVRIAATIPEEKHEHSKLPGPNLRRPTPYPPRGDSEDDSKQAVRQSVLVRLYDDVEGDEAPPTLKDYKPKSEIHPKNLLLTFSPTYHIKSDESNREKYMRQSVTIKDNSYENVLNMQHGKKVARKISSDYVKTIDQIEHQTENSIRSVEFARTRPAMSVNDYQMKNRQYHNQLKANVQKKQVSASKGLRLPGDSPLYSVSDITQEKKTSRKESQDL